MTPFHSNSHRSNTTTTISTSKPPQAAFNLCLQNFSFKNYFTILDRLFNVFIIISNK
jgi:hypothetical protein